MYRGRQIGLLCSIWKHYLFSSETDAETENIRNIIAEKIEQRSLTADELS